WAGEGPRPEQRGQYPPAVPCPARATHRGTGAVCCATSAAINTFEHVLKGRIRCAVGRGNWCSYGRHCLTTVLTAHGELWACPVPFWLPIPARPAFVLRLLLGREPAGWLSPRLGGSGRCFSSAGRWRTSAWMAQASAFWSRLTA